MNTPNETNSNNNFGLPKAEFRPMETTSNRKWLRGTLLIAAIVLVTGGAAVWWLLQNTLKNKAISLYHTQVSKEHISATESALPPETATGLDEELLADLQDLAKEVTSKQEPIAIPTIETIHAPTGLYHVIAASCIDQDLVMDYAKKLLKKGFASKIIIPVQEKQFVRLSIAQASTWKEAKEQMKELQAEFGTKIWIMKY